MFRYTTVANSRIYTVYSCCLKKQKIREYLFKLTLYSFLIQNSFLIGTKSNGRSRSGWTFFVTFLKIIRCIDIAENQRIRTQESYIRMNISVRYRRMSFTEQRRVERTSCEIWHMCPASLFHVIILLWGYFKIIYNLFIQIYL